jgi:hypothetical protein
VEQEPFEFPLQFGLRLQELHAQALRRGDEAGLVAGIDFVGFLHEAVGVPRPIGDGMDGSLEDLAVPRKPGHSRIVVIASDSLSAAYFTGTTTEYTVWQPARRLGARGTEQARP